MQCISRAGTIVAGCLLAIAAGMQEARADTGPCAQPNGGALPDLIVDAKDLGTYLSISEEKFVQQSCSVQEGFVGSPGWHTLLRFSSSTPNIGAGALVIGDPATCPNL